MPNDILMFRNSGLAVAMGNSAPEVQAAADFVTDSYEDEGFAKAIERFVLEPCGGIRCWSRSPSLRLLALPKPSPATSRTGSSHPSPHTRGPQRFAVGAVCRP